MTDTRGQAALRRRKMLGVSRDRLAAEAGVSPKTVQSFENDARPNPTSAEQIEAALDRLEQAGTPATRDRRATDSPQRRIIDAAIEGAEGTLTVRVLDDGTRAIFIVPRGGHTPTDDEVQQVLRDVRGERDRTDDGT